MVADIVVWVVEDGLEEGGRGMPARRGAARCVPPARNGSFQPQKREATRLFAPRRTQDASMPPMVRPSAGVHTAKQGRARSCGGGTRRTPWRALDDIVMRRPIIVTRAAAAAAAGARARHAATLLPPRRPHWRGAGRCSAQRASGLLR
jgi:hypothetical protein